MTESGKALAAFGPRAATAPSNVATFPGAAICAREGCGQPFVPRRGGKAQKYCSAGCRSQAWDARHPRITLDRAR